ncbi:MULTISPECIES: SpoIIIAC/SpoIIIAD family protein [Caloramator]|uniref:Stage III sporulation protein AC n=1 Tax=Caloramator proteoclasticus DSM 10124 TaxID=1121262 RepID=A0A1M4Y8Q2_9CLOT|nr:MULTISPECIES: SpoIIIAC/SpoIIIAD family protein [Caloramator]SHF02029.1 stage III sporulation protein AC [Caloramator proteoclasticus DSM 10124]
MQLDLIEILKIAVFGIILAILDKVLESVDKKEISTLVSIIGLIMILIMTVSYMSNLFKSLVAMFHL